MFSFSTSLQIKSISLLLILLFCSFIASATEPMKEDSRHVRVWNKFAADTLKLHKKLTKGKDFQIKTRIGSYANIKDFYIEHRYYLNGKVISQLQWEKDNPKQLHTIEVYLYDKKGRVIRDYTAAYLPFYHNAPTQTLVSFHHHTDKLHAFRSFDATGDKILERCTGVDIEGQQVNLLLDEHDLINDPDELIGSKEYTACFSGLKQNQLGKYIIPQ